MFAAIASGNPLQLSTEVPNSGGLQHTIVLSSTKPKSYSHISLFILPNVTFPSEFAGTVYFKLSPTEEFKLFGYLSAEKPSAIFKVKLPNANMNSAADPGDGLGEIDMEDDTPGGGLPSSNISELIIGISIEPKDQAILKLQESKAKQTALQGSSSLVLARSGTNSIATPGQLARVYPLLTQQLAAKIVQHAYNYLTGFLDPQGNVSIKRFDTWWDKFKARLENDAQFLDEVTQD
ncbi:Opi10p [Lachancea thermotolerans CBS 6340]|uniref:KLTH0D02772p n=1 Tax=Lachancea thermotolerans (strain ATCC 56472 / CBS 6340 / NRRL Y-8284) TaxID=559295 RepID=C5DG66_LACTC|nr:KLTH0D02772p [Lachancea thermotolerans CBS 6340]CAR22408.1 KLTH0D02772p [Lachancea thermotolerans CBS 6340]